MATQVAEPKVKQPKQATVALSLAVDLAARVIERRNTIPILSNLMLVSDGESVIVSGTDLDTEVSVVAACKAPSFSTTAEADALRRIVTAGNVSDALHLDGAKLALGEGPTITLNTLPAEDYHKLRAIEATTTFELPSGQLLADLEAVRPAISTEETRYYLNGILFHTKDGKLRLVATDGHRLHMIEREAPKDITLAESIVPRKCIKLLRAVLEALPVPAVKLEFGHHDACFTIGPVTIKTKLIDGTYPDYHRVIPQAAKGSLTVQAADLLGCIRSAQLILTEKQASVALDFKAGVVRAKQVGVGQMTAALPGEQAGDLPGAIGFCASYLSAIVESFSGEMQIALTDAASPTVFTAADSALLAVLMPVRLS